MLVGLATCLTLDLAHILEPCGVRVNAVELDGTPPRSRSGLHCVLAERSRESDLTAQCLCA